LGFPYQDHRQADSTTSAISPLKALTLFRCCHSMTQETTLPTVLSKTCLPIPTTLPRVGCSRMEWTSATLAVTPHRHTLTVSSYCSLKCKYIQYMCLHFQIVMDTSKSLSIVTAFSCEICCLIQGFRVIHCLLVIAVHTCVLCLPVCR